MFADEKFCASLPPTLHIDPHKYYCYIYIYTYTMHSNEEKQADDVRSWRSAIPCQRGKGEEEAAQTGLGTGEV